MFGQVGKKRGALIAMLASGSLALAPAAAIEAPPEQVKVAELSPAAESAINRGLVYLKNTQHDDGSWGHRYLVTHTALALMAFMVQGHVPDEGTYGRNMDAAITYLLGSAKKHGGYFADESSQVFYQHGYATLALAEAWGQSKRPEIGAALRRAVDITLRAESGGGWRYSPHPSGSDISCTGTAIQGLASAKEAGILVPEHVLRRALKCMRSYQSQKTGFFGYTGPGGDGPGTLFRSAIGPLCLFLLGDRTSMMLKRGMAVLLRYPDSYFKGGGQYHLAHYYAIQACYQA
ncbi:MAG: hypothetical protein V3S00_06680, partial [Dehalococcoidia bacterium]